MADDEDLETLMADLAAAELEDSHLIQASYERLLDILDIREAIADAESYTDPDLTSTARLAWDDSVYESEAEAIVQCLLAGLEDDFEGYSMCLRDFYFIQLPEITDCNPEETTELVPRSLLPYIESTS